MKKIFTLFALAFLGANMAIAQTTVEVKGTVTDADSKEPLAGAVIRIDKVKSKMTDAAGKFVVDVPEGEHEMHVSYIGYKTNKQTITVKAGDKIDLKIELKSSTLELTQVVTVSQYNKNSAKETVTTEVITKDQIKNTNSNSLGEIVTKTPGVLVQDGQISIRGGSSYSYGVGTRTAVLVDGLNLTSQDLQQVQGSFVPVENVKQVEVVKGASSVVYGSQALDGVVNI
ncbi:MAG TPA: TonB-dependent receptor plug domain-containing protein, partial [Chitinophagales bacterium]|nr:TonB-dependent receptor plug domain-containing protein [Chitinophagales bacterium]